MHHHTRFPAILVLTLIAIALVIAACGGNDKLSTVDTARAMFAAYEQTNRDALAKQFCVPELADLSFPDRDDTRSTFSAMTFTEHEVTASGAQVRVSGIVQSGDPDSSGPNAFGWTLELHKVNGTWCIASITKTPNP